MTTVQKNHSRLLALILTLAMCLAFLPGTAFAEQDPPADPSVEQTDPAPVPDGQDAPPSPSVVQGSPAPAASIQIGIYTTADMHGKVYDENPVGGQIEDGYLKVAAAMARERQEMNGTILIDNGDSIQGTAITSYNVNVQGGANNPVALCLRYCGYDVFVPGNHEFNYTLDVQNKFYAMLAAEAGGELPGKPVAAVCANLLSTETGEVADPYVPYVVKEFTVGEKTFRIGVLGFENMNVPNWDVASHYEGMQFWSDGNDAHSYVWEWEHKWKAALEEAGCDIVIVSAHSGEGSADGFNVENQLAYFVANTDGVDMVVAGHNHRAGTKNLTNSKGEPVPCVNGGTSQLTKTVLTLNSDGTHAFGESSLISLKDESNDAGLKALVKPTFDKAVEFVQSPIGTLSGQWDAVSSYRTRQADTYDLVQKAQIWAAREGLARSAAAEKYKDAKFVSITTPVAKAGFTLSKLFGAGGETADISLKDCYSFYRYDNNLLYAIEMTGQQLKNWLEHCTKTYNVSGGAVSGGGFGTDIAYGINYDVYLGEPEGNRVRNMTWPDGSEVKLTEKFVVALSSYRLAANAEADEYGWYAATGIDMTKAIWDGTVDAEFGAVGGSVTLIIGEYIRAMCKGGGTVAPGAETHWTVNAGEDPVTRIMVMSTTDMHGNVWNKDLITDGAVKNSFLKVATAVKDVRAAYGKENTILVDNGDLFQGTTVSTYNILFQNGVNNPMVLALRNIGYDAAVLGNHEFNYPWEITQSMYGQLTADADDDGSRVPVLAANLYWRDGEKAGENAFTPYITKTFAVDGQDFKVGVIGFENTDCDRFDVPANFGVNGDGTGGVTLTPPGNPKRDMAVEAEKYVAQLRKPVSEGGQGCDFVIVSYHSGMGRDNITGELTLGVNTENQIARMVAGNTGIDLVVAGHDHQTYRDKTARDAEGKDIPVINGGGRSLARAMISVAYDGEAGTFDVSVSDQGNLSLNSLEDDAGLTALIRPAATAAAGYMDTRCGAAVGEWDGSTAYKMGHNDTIDLVNRAQLWTARVNGIEMDAAATTSIVSGKYAVAPGDISLKDIYRMYRFDNYLYAVEMTGAQLKDWLEGVAAFYSAKVSGGNVTYSVKSNNVTALFYGLDFQYDLARPVGDRVVNLKLSSTGGTVAPDSTLVVGVNNYVIGQDPFVKAMGKSVSSTEEKAEIIENALWSSQETLGSEQGLVTQMVANFVEHESEGAAAGVAAAPSGWSLGYEVPIAAPDAGYVPAGNTSKISVGADKVTVTLKADLSATQQARLIRENASKPIAFSGQNLSVTIPAGTLSAGADVNAMLVAPSSGGNAVRVTHPDGSTSLLPFCTVAGGKISYIADRVGVYAVVDNSKNFPDVSGGYWAYDAIGFVTSHEFFQGMGDGIFGAAEPMTRAMLVTVLARIDGGTAASSARFSDVPDGLWYSDAVAWAAENDIVRGAGDGFEPDGEITREQLCTILARYMDYAGIELEEAVDAGTYGDLASVSSWASDAVDTALRTGLLSGKTGSLIDPQGNASRAEIATVLTRFVNAVLR